MELDLTLKWAPGWVELKMIFQSGCVWFLQLGVCGTTFISGIVTLSPPFSKFCSCIITVIAIAVNRPLGCYKVQITDCTLSTFHCMARNTEHNTLMCFGWSDSQPHLFLSLLTLSFLLLTRIHILNYVHLTII